MISTNAVSTRLTAAIPSSTASVSRQPRGEAASTADTTSAERIARGRALLADPNYPSPQVINEIAKVWLAAESANDNAPLFSRLA